MADFCGFKVQGFQSRASKFDSTLLLYPTHNINCRHQSELNQQHFPSREECITVENNENFSFSLILANDFSDELT